MIYWYEGNHVAVFSSVFISSRWHDENKSSLVPWRGSIVFVLFWMTQEEFDMERERDANIKKMLAQMYLLQEHIMENARTIKWII